jgi:hypothetical protein
MSGDVQFLHPSSTHVEVVTVSRLLTPQTFFPGREMVLRFLPLLSRY